MAPAAFAQHLPTAYATDDAAARGHVLIAACLAGMALGTVGTSLHHALCHLLGGMFDAPHAETHAIVLPYAVSYLQPAVPDAARRLAQAMEVAERDLAGSIWSLGQSVGTPAGPAVHRHPRRPDRSAHPGCPGEETAQPAPA